MRFSEYLDAEWTPALGCTEPASIALAAATAAAQVEGTIKRVHVQCDTGIYKNCFAVGIPSSNGRTGILWAAALGSLATETDAGLEIFRHNTTARIDAAGVLIREGAVTAEADAHHAQLWIDCLVERETGSGRAVTSGSHTNVVQIERDGQPLRQHQDHGETQVEAGAQVRRHVAGLSLDQLLRLARSIQAADRQRLEEGIKLNLAIARHGEKLFPDRFAAHTVKDVLGRAARLVCGGVYARMSGEDFLVMSLAGSGNKGITASVPLALWAEHLGTERERMHEALALAALMTTGTTWRLGTLSAMCGCTNAAGIGLAAGRVYLEGGTEEDIVRAINNMVGNVAGTICDGAKIGCGMKALTAVDAASRSAELALAGMGIPATDGIVGADSQQSLANLGRIAREGMLRTDHEILDIMRAKLTTPPRQ